MENNDYSLEVIKKWTDAGYLYSVKKEHLLHVAMRLETAYRRTLGSHKDNNAIDRELDSLRREGFFQKT